MKRNNLYKLVSGSILMLLPLMVQAQIALKNWTIEDHSGEVKIIVSGDTLEITAPKGLTLWYNQRLTGDYEISYRVKMLMQGGKYDRLSDLNCFWGANDPKHPGNLFARSEWRNGIFQHYKTLSLFYVGYGGNHNSTTRFPPILCQSRRIPVKHSPPWLSKNIRINRIYYSRINGTTSKSVWKKESLHIVSMVRNYSD